MNIKHIWWDIDNTLYRYGPRFDRLVKEKIYASIASFHNLPINDVAELYEQIYEGSHTAVFLFFEMTIEHKQQAFLDAKLHEIVKEDKALQEMFAVFNGREIPCSWYTNNHALHARAMIKSLGLEPEQFVYKFSPDKTLYHDSPDGINLIKDGRVAPFVHLTKVCGHLDNPQDIIFVGDTPNRDIKPAYEAGMTTALITWNQDLPHIAQLADRKYVLRDVYEVKNLVDRLSSSE